MELNLVNKALKTVIETTMPDMAKELEFYKMAYNNAQILMDKGIIDWYRHGICKKCFTLSKFCCGYCDITICVCNEHIIKCKICNINFCPSYHHDCDGIK